MSEKLEEHPYRQSVGERIWQRALRNHYPKAWRDEIDKGNLIAISHRNPDIFKLFIHDVIQHAAEYLHENESEKITAGAIADLINARSDLINEKTVRSYLESDFPHLKEYYGISMRTHAEINQKYKTAISLLWRLTGRRPTPTEIAEELHLKYSGSVKEVIDKSKWLKKLWEEGPPAETDKGAES